MKLLIIGYLTLTGVLLQTEIQAQSSGIIRYEVIKRFDISKAKMNINGVEIRAGGVLPNGEIFTPIETLERGHEFVFSDAYGIERRDLDADMRAVPMIPVEVNQKAKRIQAPFDEKTFFNLRDNIILQQLSVGKDTLAKELYQIERAYSRPTSWVTTGKTKKLIGFTCQQATATKNNATYVVWFTTQLPFTYSPEFDLTPEQGVVLQIESPDLSYKALRFDSKSKVDVELLQPNPAATVVNEDELKIIRQKAIANMRKQYIQGLMPR